MADIEETVRRLSITADEKGVDEVTGKLKDMTKAHGDLAVASEITEKASLSLGSEFDRLERKFVDGMKAQQDFAKVQSQVNAAVAQNPALQDRANALLDGAKKKYEDATSGSTVFSRALGGVQSQIVALSAGLGPVGTLLAGLGPIGLVAGAGIGLISSAMDKMKSESSRMGEVARQVRDVADTVDLSTDNFQKLIEKGAAVGLSTDQISTAFQRASVEISQLQRGSGNLYDELNRVNPELVRQLAVTKDTAAAWDVLARAYANADARQQQLIARAAFGRGGGAAARLLTATNASGGIGTLSTPDDNLSKQQIERWAELKTQIDQTTTAAQNIWASIFTDEILSLELKSLNFMKDLAVSVRNVVTEAKAFDWGSWASRMALAIQNAASAEAGLPTAPGAEAPIFAKPKVPNFTFADPGPDPAAAPTAGFTAAQGRQVIAVLGPAASAYEQLTQRIKEINAAQEQSKGIITDEIKNRAIQAASLQTVIQVEGQRLALLGELAPVSERLKAVEDQIAAARQHSVKISQDENAAIKLMTEERIAGFKLNEQATLGIASSSDIAAQKQREFALAIAMGAKTAEQQSAVLTMLDKKYEGVAERSAQAAAQLPGLAQLEQQAGSLRGQLDTLGTGIANGVSNPLVDMATGATTAGAAFKAMAANVARSLVQMAVNMTVTRTIAQGLQMVLGAFLPGGETYGVSASGNATVNGPAVFATGHTGAADIGMVAANRYVHPDYFDDAPRHHTGTPALGFNEVPFVGMKGEEIGWPDDLAKKYGGATNVTMKVNVVNTHSGADVQTKQGSDGMSVDVIVQPLEDALASRQARGRGSLARTNKAIAAGNNLRG